MKRPTRVPMDPKPRPVLGDRMQALLDRGVLHQQRWSPTQYQLALEAGEDPHDPASILHVGPSDADARIDPRDIPHEHAHAHDTHKAAEPPNLSTKVMRLLTACENLRTIAMKLRTSTTAHAGTPSVRVVRDELPRRHDGAAVCARR
jgi:hypothetical protein